MGAKRRSDFPKFVESLRRIAGLGVGQFGTVSLVADRAGQTFALKALHKVHLVATGMVEAVKRERRLLARVHHPFVVRLDRSFQNAHTIFLAMAPVLGGELYALLHLLGRLARPTSPSRACVTEALAFVHAMRVARTRDLKPENLLLRGGLSQGGRFSGSQRSSAPTGAFPHRVRHARVPRARGCAPRALWLRR